MTRFWIAPIALVLAFGITACGKDETDSARGDIIEIVETLSSAARAGNGEKICRETFAADLRISVSRAAKTSCGIAVRKSLYSPDASYSMEDVVIDADNATATVIDHKKRLSTLSLVKEDGVWRISKIN